MGHKRLVVEYTSIRVYEYNVVRVIVEPTFLIADIGQLIIDQKDVCSDLD